MTSFRRDLPQLVQVDPWGVGTFDLLYQEFVTGLKNEPPYLEGSPVWCFPEMEDGKEKIFWHLTHREDEATTDRLPDLRRCERIRWVRWLIENCRDDKVLFWDYKESNGQIHTYLWLKEEKFVVILKKYPNNSRRLVTSYYVDKPKKEQTFMSKYKRKI